MGGQKFQYDESGGTFFYFLLSFLALLLIPGTYYWWPRKRREDPAKYEKECHCDDCKKKKLILQSNEPWKGTKQMLTKLLIISGWLILALLAYKVSQFDYEYANFDPYEILGIPLGASQADIRKQYRKLSLILHPDKETGNEKAFMKLTKAYQALTDEEARRNWEKYGNPDGPGAMSFGIALPSWIVEKENSVWVLGLYALVFMVALPTVVGMWWYKSIRYSGDQVLLNTTQMYYYFFHKTPSMALKRVIMILAASLEFEKKHNSEIVERPTDNEEVPHLIKQIPNLSEKNRERPLCFLYSLKARAIIHAHLSRIPLNPETLDKDRQYIVKKCPYLIQEMVNCVSQLILLAYARRIPRLPNIETIENCMKLCPMIVQAMWEYKSPLLQLPYVTDDNLKYFVNKKRYIKTIQQFAQLKHEERRSILRNLSDEQYHDVMKVAGKMPYIEFKVRSEVIDDENPTVYTAGAIVTVTVTLIRHDMSILFGDDTKAAQHAPPQEMLEDLAEKEKEQEDQEQPPKKEEQAKKPVWQKQQKKGKKTNKKSSRGQKTSSRSTPAKKVDEKPQAPSEQSHEIPTKKVAAESGDESDMSDDDVERSDDEENEHSQGDKKGSSVEDDDTEWEKFQARLHKREKVLEGRSKQSHSVHCPFFPEDKQEYWWVYISDRKSHTLLTSPYHVTALVEEEEVQLKFTAPRWPGIYTFTVCLKSDSYLGFDQMQDIKLDVKEAPEIPTEHPQWEMSDEEEDEQEAEGSDVSEFTTDEDVEDDQD
ncbi:translocation protein SEC63 homolog [Schistocerca serialis cubense]|uniref:translocation protein SEC63 homolog n=1 Tax=Schistocerca nitens TaxID=7011 RepID=UPI002118E2F8|nr:translocation protein SEC63 homolog [Schistocerca nitens]XP_049942378.1 translocation protein SEC63 homolog [Schistocerca serialis cubense]